MDDKARTARKKRKAKIGKKSAEPVAAAESRAQAESIQVKRGLYAGVKERVAATKASAHKRILKRTGRPSKYTAGLGKAICRRMALGESVRSISRDPEMPHRDTIMVWALDLTECSAGEKEPFSDQYARAMDIRVDGLVDEIPDIADDASNDFIERELKNGTIQMITDHENINRSRLRVEARLQLARICRPKKYGALLKQAGEQGGPLQIQFVPLIQEKAK